MITVYKLCAKNRWVWNNFAAFNSYYLIFKLNLKTDYFMKKLITLFVTIFLISSNYAAFATGIFDKNFTGTQKEYFADGKLKYEVNVIKGKKQGLEIFWYPSGKKQIQTNYLDDKEDGVWNQWYENGQLKLEANYKNGREHGSFTQWYDNGQKRVQGNFVNGKKEGLETAWNKDGSVKYSSTYKDGQEIKQ
jgi:antitoxin component YwqK of YwqJK toxin-antitoxin module